MKYFLYAVIISLFLVLSASAQKVEDTTLESISEIQGSWIGGPLYKFSRANSQNASFIGGFCSWRFDNSLTLGLAGFGLYNRVEAPGQSSLTQAHILYIKSGYGGVLTGYRLYETNLFSCYSQLLIGGGELRYDFIDANDFNYHGSSAFFVLEPEVNFEFQFYKYAKMVVGGGYRFVSGVKMDDLKNKDISGYSINIAFVLGKF